MIEKTEAIALRIAPHSRTSHIATWLTPGHGRLITLLKGSARPKSVFLGQFDLFYTCEILCSLRAHTAVHTVRECCPLVMRPRFRDDWRAMACASYLADLSSRVSLDGHPQPELFSLLTQALDFLSERPAREAALYWFELKLLSLLGFGLQLKHCASCRCPLEDADKAGFSAPAGGLLCPSCASSAATPPSPLPPDGLAMLRNWQAAYAPLLAHQTRCSRAQSAWIRQTLGASLHYHLDSNVPSRYIAFETLDFNPSMGVDE